MNEKIKVSVPILTLNSGKYLERCLESIKNVAEIIVMDGNSTDNTLEIARKYGAKIYKQFETDEPNQKIENFTEMRLKLWSLVTEPWMFLLDSDEFATPELMEEISEIIARDEKDTAYLIPRLQIIKGSRLIKHNFSYPYNYMRLFRRDSGITLKDKAVHENLVIPESITQKLTKNYCITDLLTNEERMEKDKHYLKLEFATKPRFGWYKTVHKATINILKGLHIVEMSVIIYFKYGFKESLPPKYVWRFVRYHFLIAWYLIKRKFVKI